MSASTKTVHLFVHKTAPLYHSSASPAAKTAHFGSNISALKLKRCVFFPVASHGCLVVKTLARRQNAAYVFTSIQTTTCACTPVSCAIRKSLLKFTPTEPLSNVPSTPLKIHLASRGVKPPMRLRPKPICSSLVLFNSFASYWRTNSMMQNLLADQGGLLLDSTYIT